MDFYLPPNLPAVGISWESILPTLVPRLDGAPHSWTTSLLPDTDHTASVQVNCDHSGFTIQVDVQHFSPEELLVKVTGQFVEVQGKHEEKKDGAGKVTRQFNRRYRIPEGVDTMALESAVSPQGMLIISAPLLQDGDPKTMGH